MSGSAEAAKAIYDEVTKALDSGKLKRTTRAFNECGPGNDLARALALDSRKRARFYARSTGIEGASLSYSYYFDTDGKLRYGLINGASEAGGLIEVRIGFAPDGTRVSETHVTLAGPPYPFPDAWPQGDFQVKDPQALYAAPNACGEQAPAPTPTGTPKAKPMASPVAKPQ